MKRPLLFLRVLFHWKTNRQAEGQQYVYVAKNTDESLDVKALVNKHIILTGKTLCRMAVSFRKKRRYFQALQMAIY